MALVLKGSTATAGAKTARTNLFKATVIAVKESGTPLKDALLTSCSDFGTEPAKSYSTSAAHSHYGSFKKAVGKVISDPKNKEYEEVMEILESEPKCFLAMGAAVQEILNDEAHPAYDRMARVLTEAGLVGDDEEGDDEMEARSDVPDDLDAIEADRAQM